MPTDKNECALEKLLRLISELNDTIVAENFMKAKQYIAAKRLVQAVLDTSSACDLPTERLNTILDHANKAEDFINECLRIGMSLSELTVSGQKEIPADVTALALKKIRVESLYDEIVDQFPSTT